MEPSDLPASPKPEKIHALLIGIDRYLPPQNGSDGLYPNLDGCVRDALRVETWLREEWRVAPEQIEKLLAPVAQTEPPETSPTYENMVNALQRLRRRASREDQVWIHYSGHGGRVPTHYREVKFHDSDEALVPTNVGDPQARYLRDIELAHLLEELAQAGPAVTIVLDCCHSGGVFRHGHSGVKRKRRGTGLVDKTARSGESLVASASDLRRNWRLVRKNYRRGLKPMSNWHCEPKGYVLLAACRAHEQACEDIYDGVHPGGALTHWLLESARALPREVTYRDLYNRVRAHLQLHAPGQTPLLEGVGDHFVLSTRRMDPHASVTVLATDPGTGKVRLDVGAAQGVETGTKWVVYPAGSSHREHSRPSIATLELVEVGATSSWAVATNRVAAIELGAPAQMVPATKNHRRIRTVQLMPELSSRPEMLTKVGRTVTAGRHLEVLRENDLASPPADFGIAATDQGYEILGSTGQRLGGVEPIPFEASRAERLTSWNLVHLARFQDVLEQTNPDPTSPLNRGLALSLHRLAGPPADTVKQTDLITSSNPSEFQVGDWVCLRLKNLSYQVLNVTLLNLRYSNWRVQRIFPAHAHFQPLEPDEEILLPFELERQENEIIKAFGTQDATSFDSLQLPPIDHHSRHYRPLDLPSMGWTVCDLKIEMTHQAR